MPTCMVPWYATAICTTLITAFVFVRKWFNAEVLYLIISQKSYINVDLILHEYKKSMKIPKG